MERIISFKSNKSWTKDIKSPNDIFASPSFIRAMVFFSGTIDVDKFIETMNESFKDYEVLLSTLNLDINNNLSISCNENSDIEILEIEKRPNELINEIKNQNSFLPCKVISLDQQSGCTLKLNGLKTCAFKLTTLKNGFIIGININHSLFDHVGICYYLKHLSQLYSHGQIINLKKPHIKEYSIENGTQFNDFNEAIRYATKSNGFFYFPDTSSQGKLNQDIFSKNKVLEIQFNTNEINKIKCTINEFISQNDIITSILFKLFTFTKLLKDNDTFYLKYIYNTRKYENLGEDSLGNHYKYCCLPLKVLECRSLSITDIAKISRECSNQINFQQFLNDIKWFKYTQDEMHDNLGYFTPSIYFTILSNISQYKYDDIQFNDSALTSFKLMCAASYGTNFIYKDKNEYNESIIKTTISVPPDSIDDIIEFSIKSKLFKVNI